KRSNRSLSLVYAHARECGAATFPQPLGRGFRLCEELALATSKCSNICSARNTTPSRRPLSFRGRQSAIFQTAVKYGRIPPPVHIPARTPIIVLTNDIRPMALQHIIGRRQRHPGLSCCDQCIDRLLNGPQPVRWLA